MNNKPTVKPLTFPPAVSPPGSMRPADRAQIAKDIAHAQRSLDRVYKIASVHKDLALAKTITEINRRLGEQIVALHGGPMRLTPAELVV